MKQWRRNWSGRGSSKGPSGAVLSNDSYLGALAGRLYSGTDRFD